MTKASHAQHLARMSMVGGASDDGSAGGSLPASGLAGAILDLSPVGYWKLDDTTASAIDSSGNANTGTHGTNVTLADVSGGDGGLYPSYVVGDDSDSYGTIIPHNVNQRIETASPSGLTVFAMVRTTSIAFGRRGIVGKQDGWHAARYIDGNELRTHLSNGNAAREYDTSTLDNLAVNTWYAQTYVYTGGTDYPELWQDGTKQTGGSQSGSGTANTGATAPLEISYEYGATSRWEGSIAHVALFAGVLTDTEIGTLHTAAADEGW
jgi:hypothetical protein